MLNINNLLLSRVEEELSSFRLDIKNSGSKDNSISVINAEGCQITTPAWIISDKGSGVVISGNGYKQFVKIKIIKSGSLILSFRGADKRFNGERFPLYTDYKSIKIDGKEILSIPVITWHDLPYRYEMPVSEGQEIAIEFELKPHKYSDENLKETLLRLFPNNNDDIQECCDKKGNLDEYRLKYYHPKVIAITGYYYTGSSTVVGFFNEFDNTTVMGYCEKQYSVQIKSNSEVAFFTNSNFFNFIDIFYSKNILERDLIIKKFIEEIYNCYDKKGTKSYEKNYIFYSDEFLQASVNLFYNVLDFDEYTINFMKNKRFPTKWNSSDEKFQNCSFMHGKGISQYVFYQFKNISADEFEKFVGDYVNAIFQQIPCNDFLICDQLIAKYSEKYSILDKLNSYMVGNKIKEIGIYRDPRDRFLSAFRNDINALARDVNIYTSRYTRGNLGNAMSQSNPNRLMIRFEDMVLKYEETTKKIMDFIGMDPIHHVAPKSVFDPAISVVNVGAYKQFIDQDFMKQIEEKMPEYCYYPEKENLSQEALDLLKGTEND